MPEAKEYMHEEKDHNKIESIRVPLSFLESTGGGHLLDPPAACCASTPPPTQLVVDNVTDGVFMGNGVEGGGT